MKKISIFICAICAICGSFSCSDILETESTRQNIEPSITEKTDSVFYAFGILQAMQELADQYVFQGEMRGDLVKMTPYTDKNLQQLYNFSATTENKYDSAYVYYRVINNCNYYIAHCDTNLYNGSTNVIIDKYVAAKAIRAWAYLQLGRNYERVPFFTEPLMQISQIERGFPEMTLPEIVEHLASDLEQYTGYQTPSLGYVSTLVGVESPNWESTPKSFLPMLCFVPVDVVLGDMYLEVGNYSAAASHFITYLTKVAPDRGSIYSGYHAPMASKTLSIGRMGIGMSGDDDLPDVNNFPNRNIYVEQASGNWASIFGRNNVNDIVTYIPMASKAQNGKTTQVPLTFGFDYYATPEENKRSGAPYVDEIQLLPSDAYNLLSDSTEYYYYSGYTGQAAGDLYDSVRIAKAGDMRLRSVIHQEESGDTTIQWIDKYKYATIVLYRTSTIWLRLAETFNRLDMPDAAFAILKDGITEKILERDGMGVYSVDYITENTRQLLMSRYPLLSQENVDRFTTPRRVYGIHTHGAGAAASDYPTGSQSGRNTYHTGKSPYQFDRMVGLKMQELAEKYDIEVGTTRQDTINAIEDLICDEYALETAFEGNRFSDLCRMARHKNESGLYGGNFGSIWLARKLAYKNPTKDLTNPTNWYLPFK